MSGRNKATPHMGAVLAMALTVGVMMSALMTAAAAQAAAPAFAPATVAALNSIVQNGMTSSGTPGMAVGVWAPGRGTYIRHFGTDKVKTGAPFRVADHVRIASISKSFTATAILQLVGRRRLKLSDHLSRFVKGIPNGRRITVKELLNMTAGVFDYTTDATFLRRYQANPQIPFSVKSFMAIIHRHRPSFAPGTSVEYSDSNYYLLGLIVQRVTHSTLAQVIQSRIIAPLRLRETSYPSTSAMPSPFSRGYFSASPMSPLRDVTVSNPDLAFGAGAMISTLGDVKLWANALGTGTLLTPAVQAQRLRTVALPGGIPGKISLRYGLGILNLNGFVGHNGALLGYGTAMFYLPSAHATFVVEGNNNNLTLTEPTDIFVQLADYLFPTQFPGGI